MDHTAVIAVAVIAALVVAPTAYLWDYLREGEYLSKLASLVTIYSLGITPPGYFLKKKLDAMRERQTASIGIIAELASARDGLDDKKYGDLKIATLDDGQKIHFMNRMLNHGTYDSLVMSGKMIVINPCLQQPIHDIFKIIIDRNRFLQKIRSMEETGDRRLFSYRYYRQLGSAEDMLLDRIPPLLDLLRKESGLSRV